MRFLGVLLALCLLCPPCLANTGKEFTTSVIYGTLAGALVGAATLAFTSNPGENLNNVARGASYGLYAGILLGLYVTYGVSDNPEPNTETRPEETPTGFGVPPDQTPQDQNGQPQGRIQNLQHDQFTMLPPSLFPVFARNSQGIQTLGVGANLVTIQF